MLSLAELERAARVLADLVAGHRIQDAVQPDATRVVLTTFGGEPGSSQRRHHVLLCCRPGTARLSLVPERPRGQTPPPSFVQLLRARVVGSVVADVRVVEGDRVACLALRGPADLEIRLALMGRRSNVWLLDADLRVLGALRPWRETRPELSPGEPWRAAASPPPARGSDRFAAESDAALWQAIERVYAEREESEQGESLARRIRRALARERRRLDRKHEKLAAELAAARDAEQLAREGELLKGALSRARRGDRELRVRDYASGEEIVISLDPSLSPAENLERRFRRYRKALRGLARAGAQQESVSEARAQLERLEEGLREAGGDPAHLAQLAQRPDLSALLARHAPAEPRRPEPRQKPQRLAGRAVPGRLVPRRYRSAGGLEVWVGRSDEGNDHLTTRLARGSDLFFHLDGAPGSHVVLRTEGRGDPPSEAVLDACELAVHFSKQRNASRADVHVVPIANVRKPRGAKPGLVTVHGGRTVHLRRVPARLERILAARIEDS